MLLQISEPDSGQSVQRERKRGLGIDLGTTNSLVAVKTISGVDVIPDDRGNVLLPSVVHFSEQVTVGDEAKATASTDPKNTIVSAKRLMGRSRDDLTEAQTLGLVDSERLAFDTDCGAKTPVEVSAEILRALAQRAAADGAQADGVVITVPAYFDDSQRQATRQAAELAGLNVLRMLNEPTAAAVAYGLDESIEESSVVAVYDLGGGTFDISILRMERGLLRVLATGGDSALGGDDFDDCIVDWLTTSWSLDSLDYAERRELSALARDIKESLTESTEVSVAPPSFRGECRSLKMSREQFNDITHALVDRTLGACRQAMSDAGVNEVAQVVLVGGSTRMPIIAAEVEQFFGCEPLCTLDPDQVVALGAAMQADVLVGNGDGDEALLLDVIPLSLGLET